MASYNRTAWPQRFFAGIERRGKGTFAPLVEDPRRRSVVIEETETTVPVLFLDRSASREDDQPARVQWSQWMTAAENPYFARALANRIWSQLMGRGLVEPVDDFRESNAPSHPELLDDLADAFCASGFNVDYLQGAICLSRAYQRTSRQTHPAQARPELFARAAIKRLSGEQFFDSVVQATGYVAVDQRGGTLRSKRGHLVKSWH